jgi:hypothetical protein
MGSTPEGGGASCPGGGLMQGAAMARLVPSLLMIASLLGGCTLVDQRTFNPRAGMEPPPPPSTAPGPPPPLITVDFEKPNPAYEAPLREAVDQALSRKQTVEFDVITIVPAVGLPAQQVDAAISIRADARDIARVIGNEGVDPDRIHMLARAEPGVTARQVRVYVH